MKTTTIKFLLASFFSLVVGYTYASFNDSIKKDTGSSWSFHFQLTAIEQYHGYFHSPYAGRNSLQDTTEQDMSLTATLFIGRRLWKNAALYFNPEMSGGKGFSHTTGIAGFPNGEIYRVGNPEPVAYIARCYFQQSFALSGSRDSSFADDKNQVNQPLPDKRITLSIGKFCLADFFDNNSYSHDPRSQFMNWAIMDNGSWDYASNTRGYTYAVVAQLIQPKWFVNAAYAMETIYANGADLDWNITKVFGLNAEVGYNYKVNDRTGGLSFLVFLNQTRAGTYKQALIDLSNGLPNALEIDSLSAYKENKKYGIGLNWNHPIGKYLGLFARAGWNDGHTATWSYTEIDQTASAGISMDGKLWKREKDNLGIAIVMNGLSKEHEDFLNAGGYGFVVGDGKLPDYGTERILEAYYQANFYNHWYLALDYQYVQNPGYNADRGPVNIGSLRVHIEF